MVTYYSLFESSISAISSAPGVLLHLLTSIEIPKLSANEKISKKAALPMPG